MKRFDICSQYCTIEEYEDGEYVLHSEAQERIDALTAERDAVLKDRDALQNLATCECGDEFTAHDKGTCGNCKCAESIPPSIPEGYVMVPVIVSPEIESVYSNSTGAYQSAQELHDAMIAASQKGGA